MSLIFLSAAIFVALTYDLSANFVRTLELIDSVILIIFVVEYVLRLWVARRKLRHVLRIYSLIDLIAILPFFLWFGPLQFIRVIRVVRVLRILRLIRFIKSREFVFGRVTKAHLVVIHIAYTLFAIIFVTAGMFYYVESAVNPAINSFLDALYFSISTLTTVGFGDIVPVSTNGRIVTILMILTGIATIPWQVAHAVQALVLDKNDQDAKFCKSCGKKLLN
jgi:voltage-gated potassium channel